MRDGGPCPLCGGAPLCKGLGVIAYEVPVGHPDFGKLHRCPHYPTEHDQERRERLRRLSNLGAFADRTFDNFTWDIPTYEPAQRESLRYAMLVAQAFTHNPDGWLLLEGTYGCGKTHLAAAVGNGRLAAGDFVLFITAPDLLDHLRSAYGPEAELGYDQTFERMRDAQLLILDDLGAENPSAWAMEKLFQLLNHRYNHRLPTVITTNADLERLDPRIRSRLLDENVIRRTRIIAPDYRTPQGRVQDQLTDLALYRDMTFEQFDTVTRLTGNERQELQYVLNLARHYAEQPLGWVVFTGGYGTGKTHLAAAIAHTQRARGGQVIFVTVPNLLDHLRVSFDPKAGVSFDQRFNLIRSTPLLVLDDLGTENASPWAREKLFQLLDYRYNAVLPTVITTARAVEDLDRRLASRLIDQRRCQIIAIHSVPAYAQRINRPR